VADQRTDANVSEVMAPGAITIGDLYRVMTDIQKDLQQVTVQMTGSVITSGALEAARQDHETRIRILEKAYQRAMGIAIFVSSVAGIISGWLAGGHHG
jgi:hypothetical protein